MIEKMPMDNEVDNIKEINNDNENKHHLFSYYEVKYKLMQIYGKPKNDAEKIFLSKKSKEVWRRMPKFKIKKSLHKELHQNVCKECGASDVSIRKRTQRA